MTRSNLKANPRDMVAMNVASNHIRENCKMYKERMKKEKFRNSKITMVASESDEELWQLYQIRLLLGFG